MFKSITRRWLDPRVALSGPKLYNLFQTAIGAERTREALYREHISPLNGRSLLDLGCGPAPILDKVPTGIRYVGVDLNERYVAATAARLEARSPTNPKSEAVHAEVVEFLRRNTERYDVVLAIGLLHHLDDLGCGELLELTTRALSPGGNLITFDGAYTESQSWLERKILNLDRGAFVRTVDAFESLVPESYELSATVRSDLLRIPYTHLIMRCRLR